MSFGEKLRNAIEKIKNSTALDKETVKEAVKELQRALISSDVEVSLVLKLSKHIEEQAFVDLPKEINRREHVVKVTYDALTDLLGGKKEIPLNPKRILLVGLQGNGKTTSAAKLAKYYQKRGKKVGLLCADAFRPAAFEQLKQLSEQIQAPFYGLKEEKNSSKIAEQGLKELEKQKCDLIIIDSAGRSGLDEELTKEIKAINQIVKAEFKWLVIGADVGQIAKKQAESFHNSVGVNGVIITRMDGSAKGGGALSACAVTDSPVYFIGIGEKINDLEAFDAERFLSRIMGYGDLEGLLEKIKEIDSQEIDAEALMRGEFNLQIFYEQLKATRQMGPMNKVMEMLGLKQQIPEELMQTSEEKLNSFRFIMDSMTKKEKLEPEIISSSRIERIAKGSGRKETEVRELLKQYKQMKKMFKQMNNIDEKKFEKEGIQGLFKGMKGIGKKRKKFKIR
ncbi:MAG: signal recognition particle protein [Candidatus Diapherotrites archaeon]|nr:signal recognition particle protein [Candidatus Diapherotrites archaeon]